MKINLYFYQFVFIFIIISLFKNTSCDNCGDWDTYKDEKCYKVVKEFKNHDEAAQLCADKFNATLASVLSKEEQDHLQILLFTQNKALNSVWLGAKRVSNTSFQWEDGNRFGYTYWDPDDPHNAEDNCVEMTYSKENTKLGLWDDVDCGKVNEVLCEKSQAWTLERLGQVVVELRKQVDEKTPVPVNFTYIQLPTQPQPNELWPEFSWKEVSATYAGLFFRVVGGGSEKFGTVQPESSPRLQSVEMVSSSKSAARPTKLDIPQNGDASAQIYIGSSPIESAQTSDEHLKFKLTSAEVRPRNQAIRIWVRVK
jgi:hypothetical protein